MENGKFNARLFNPFGLPFLQNESSVTLDVTTTLSSGYPASKYPKSEI